MPKDEDIVLAVGEAQVLDVPFASAQRYFVEVTMYTGRVLEGQAKLLMDLIGM